MERDGRLKRGRQFGHFANKGDSIHHCPPSSGLLVINDTAALKLVVLVNICKMGNEMKLLKKKLS